jgi:Pentapeptide repeats (8 copies)
MVIGGVATLVLFLAVVIVLARTGGAKAVSDNAAVIGALLALGGVFTAQMVSIALEDQRTHEARALEDRRTQESRELEAQRAHEAALLNYFEQVGTLLIEQPLRDASPGDNLSTVVRAQTLTALEGLDPDRKRILLQFLHESGLIHRNKPVVSLAWANLRKADLRFANLNEADLSGAFLIGADLNGAFLNWAILSSFLSEADLSGAGLGGAILSGAFLNGTILSGAILSDADLSGASLIGTNLRGTDLRGADLRGANLKGARGWTAEDLRAAKHLEGATMPDGQTLKSAANPDGPTFDEWLKSQGRREDGENSSPS